ncbi:phosphoenolpyruvate-utilizing protein (plasmid) [Rhodococcus sp. ZPP]|uniref:PEP-utilizing enzyme n=1 Tax=Rhodococcus sp. ZPP TaxID=2749906 RepID=UPI001AD87EB7|nr:PEP-utilizing enzyme [Rhodococcus sp. ZPP]QTJ70736.1 phosphoenolpyruvate-utilizing protein [Rhodococcus sp. ZPP]
MTEHSDPVRGYSQPDRCWTFTNVSEATPDILSPLCWSVWDRPLQETLLASLAALGVLSRSDVVVSSDQNFNGTGVIYGRQAFNVDVMREVMSKVPGMNIDDFERDLLGTVRPNASTPPGASLWRIPLIAAKAPYALVSSAREVERNYHATKAWWRSEVFNVHQGAPPKRPPLEDLLYARDRFARSFYLHAFTRFALVSIQGAVCKTAARIGVPALGTAALAGQGGVTETQLAEDTWRLARGEMGIASFLAEYGYRGPNEGNVYTKSWREQPDRVRAMAKAQANRAELERPTVRAQRAAEAARDAAASLIGAVGAKDRVLLRFMLARARTVIPRLEIGKAAYVMPLDGVRAAARRLGAELTRQGLLEQIDDVFFLAIPELQLLAARQLTEAPELVQYRKATRETYREMTLPVHFTGMPEPLVTTAASPQTDEPIFLTGAASGGGTVEGRARVLLDPNDDIELDDGDILVCKFTDPSWAPLFTLADALVIDLGGAASHGAVVAREIGIPYVIGTQTGTTIIRDGDRLRVDGNNNLVTILP